MRLGFGEILLILVIALLVFGPSKLPQLGEALGKGIRNFKKGTLEPDADETVPDEADQHRLAAGSPDARPASSQAPVGAKKA
jgi:sec-independent protein translocase protein TatA